MHRTRSILRLGRGQAAAFISFVGCVTDCLLSTPAVAEPLEICRAGKPHVYLVCPVLQGPTSQIVASTINGFLLRSYGWELPPDWLRLHGFPLLPQYDGIYFKTPL